MTIDKQPAVLYSGAILHPTSIHNLEYAENVVIGVDANGVIALVDKEKGIEVLKKEYPEASVVACNSTGVSFFAPGFVDTHIHASQYPNSGIFGNSTLLDWLYTYTFPMEASFKDLNRATEIYTSVVKRTLAHGTTTASYFATLHVEATNRLADICLELGQRAFVGRVCMTRNTPDFYQDASEEEAAKADQAVIDYCAKIDSKREIICPIVTPRFAPHCTPKTLKRLGQLCKDEHLPCQTHISENLQEIAWVKELFPESKNYTDVYDEAGLLTDRTVLAHGIHLSDDEIQVIKDRGSGISHCPTSNSSLTSGEARVKQMMAKGVKLSLGTDVSGGYSPSILMNARMAHQVSRHLAMETKTESDKLSVEEAICLATLGGAQCLGLEDKIGSFEVGKHWDAQLVDLSGNFDLFEWAIPKDDKEKTSYLASKWLFLGDDRNTRKVWVKGRCVVSK